MKDTPGREIGGTKGVQQGARPARLFILKEMRYLIAVTKSRLVACKLKIEA